MSDAISRHLHLTAEQEHAAAAETRRAFIEAAPGSGKTTVAAERFGVIRYSGQGDLRRVLGLSFARSARRELAGRILRRWGHRALDWPHGVLTLDAFHLDLLHHMLRTAIIRWPGGHTDLTVLDTWRGQAGSYMTQELRYRRVAALNGVNVVSVGRSIVQPTYGIGRRDVFDGYLAAGICTHEEVRQLLAVMLRDQRLRGELAKYISSTTRTIVVDEIFDANPLDLAAIELAVEAGISATLIGDPWQALYDFRGARPDLVPQLVGAYDFQTLQVTRSFRFETADMKLIAAHLRTGRPVPLQAGPVDDCDVVLAQHWRQLWDCSDRVLPLSFGRIDNQTDAAVVILLDRLVNAHYGHDAIYGVEAINLLGLDADTVRVDGGLLLDGVLERLRAGTPAAASAAIKQLRASLRALGSQRQLRSLPGPSEAELLERLQALARRMSHRRLIPGMTVHQAKGKEWNVVGVRLTQVQVDRLATGLSENDFDDRLLYVALTRARRAVWLV